MDEIEAGAILRAKREETNMSRAEVADKLNVSEETIRKLEDGEHDQLRGSVFVRGYIRYYAKLLDVDVSEILEEKHEVAIEPVDDDLDYTQDETILRHTRIWGSVIVLIVLAFVVYSWWLESRPVAVPPPVAPPAAEEPFTESDAALESPTMDEIQSSPEPPSEPPPEVSPATSPWPPTPPAVQWDEPAEPTESTESTESVEPTTAVEPTTESTAKTVLDAFVEVRLETGDHESWVQVTDADGDLLFERLLGPFSQARVYGTAPFNFRIGYVRGVTLSIGGEVYPFSQHESRGMAVFVAP